MQNPHDEAYYGSKLEQDRPDADVGVIVARFQCHELHQGHKDIIHTAMQNHDKVIIFLGIAPTRGMRNNSLDFRARKEMLLEAYPSIDVLYIKDVRCDKLWSTRLDAQIDDLIGPGSTALLYGGEDSFISHYFGKWPTVALRQSSYISATEVRKQIARTTRPSADFRAGVIWNAYNQYPRLIPTVDVAILNEDSQVLLARKPDEVKFRFVGGHAEPTIQVHDELVYETNAIREVVEETGIEIGDVTYIDSALIDDWRYRGECDKIGTLFFRAKYLHGAPTPMDDVEELRWFGLFADRTRDMIVDEHLILWDMLRRNLDGNR